MNTPENIQRPDYTEQEFTEHPEYSQITGTFREQANAVQAIEELRQHGFQEIQLTEYKPAIADERGGTLQYTDDLRYFVHVLAERKEQEAVSVLVEHGSNNSDLPRGLELVQGRLTRTGVDPTAPSQGGAGPSSAAEHNVADDLVKERYNP